MMSGYICEKCKREFKYQIYLDSHTQAMHPGGVSNMISKESKSKIGIILLIGILLVVVIGIGLSIVNAKTYPQIPMIGLIEKSLISLISRKRSPKKIQKQCLKHPMVKNKPELFLNYILSRFEGNQD